MRSPIQRITGITLTVYTIFHSSCPCRAVSRCTRGFGPGLRGAKGRPSRRSSIAIHSGLPNGRPMVGARSIREVAAASVGMARSAAKSGISARNDATVASSSSSPASCARVLDHGQSSARLTNPRDHWIEPDVAGRRQQMRLVHHHRAKAALEQMARPPEPSVDRPGVAPVRFGKGCPQPIRSVGVTIRWT